MGRWCSDVWVAQAAQDIVGGIDRDGVEGRRGRVGAVWHDPHGRNEDGRGMDVDADEGV